MELDPFFLSLGEAVSISAAGPASHLSIISSSPLRDGFLSMGQDLVSGQTLPREIR